jgi:hypothetical protein
MFTIKCGKCGMTHNLTEERLAENIYGRIYPNCT